MNDWKTPPPRANKKKIRILAIAHLSLIPSLMLRKKGIEMEVLIQVQNLVSDYLPGLLKNLLCDL